MTTPDDDKLLRETVARAIVAEEVRNDLVHRVDLAIRVLSGTGFPENRSPREIISDWLDDLDWRQIEGEALSGDMTEPTATRWHRILKGRLPE